jgi:hypothetical protein
MKGRQFVVLAVAMLVCALLVLGVWPAPWSYVIRHSPTHTTAIHVGHLVTVVGVPLTLLVCGVLFVLAGAERDRSAVRAGE